MAKRNRDSPSCWPAVDPARAKARRLLFMGKSLAEVARQTSIPNGSVVVQKGIMEQAGCFQPGPYGVDQAAVILGLSARRVRTYCKEGRLGKQVGKRSYAITRQELIDFPLERKPGRRAKGEE